MYEIAIIDYGINNLFSVKRAFDILGTKSVITSDLDVIASSKSVILPGVGAFPYAMSNLKKLNLDKSIYQFVRSGKPIMGICLGMQLLMESSVEFEKVDGLGLIKGTTCKFKYQKIDNESYPIPQIGWNKIHKGTNHWENTILNKNSNEDFMYFVHSYYVIPSENISLADTIYGDIHYCSAFQKENIIGVQFHPEKSGMIGLNIFKSFIEMI